MDEGYRQLHESFVSGHNGTSPAEILLAGAPQNLSVLLAAALSVVLGWAGDGSGLATGPGRLRLVEGAVLFGPVLLSLTCCSDPPSSMALSCVLAAGCAWLVWRIRGPAGKLGLKTPDKRDWEEKICKPRFLPFVTNYRATMLVTTAICILAVDFQVFPRRFAKTEDFGFSLMDAGVGSFVFAAGLVSQEARRGAAADGGPMRRRWGYLAKSALECVPMLALGAARLLSVKGTGYHEHVTEYGLHWNFFFTMAACKALSSLCFCVLPVSCSWATGLLIATLHETALSSGAAEWVLSPDTPRDTLWGANREGIASVPGYVATYLVGVSWGCELAGMGGDTLGDSWGKAMKLVRWSLAEWAFLVFSLHFLELRQPSRRLANCAYFQWMVAYNLTLLTLFLLTDLTVVVLCQTANKVQQSSHRRQGPRAKRQPDPAQSPPDAPLVPYAGHRAPFTLRAVSHNGLAFFLLANLLTGAVNLSVNTLGISSCPAVLVVASYLLALHAFAVSCYSGNIKLKVW